MERSRRSRVLICIEDGPECCLFVGYADEGSIARRSARSTKFRELMGFG